MEVLIENIIIYSLVAACMLVIVFVYLRKQKKESLLVEEKIAFAREEGLYEPLSLHPVIDVNSCIKSGACIKPFSRYHKSAMGYPTLRAVCIATRRSVHANRAEGVGCSHTQSRNLRRNQPWTPLS
jgi:hypothetical protein